MFDGFTAPPLSASSAASASAHMSKVNARAHGFSISDLDSGRGSSWSSVSYTTPHPNRNLIYLCSEAQLCELLAFVFVFHSYILWLVFLIFFEFPFFFAAQKVCCKIELFMIERQPKVFHYEIEYGLGNNS